MDQANDPGERIEESVRHALRLVGPGDYGDEYNGDGDAPDAPAAA
jgi:hypothetical protein